MINVKPDPWMFFEQTSDETFVREIWNGLDRISSMTFKLGETLDYIPTGTKILCILYLYLYCIFIHFENIILLAITEY